MLLSEVGNDYAGFKEFLEQTILDRKDVRRNMRNKVFEKYLNYPQINQSIASETTCWDIVGWFA